MDKLINLAMILCPVLIFTLLGSMLPNKQLRLMVIVTVLVLVGVLIGYSFF